ncbi:chaperone heat-shock protein [Caballeronia sordidicola]|uniref:Chaperone heat-shock protein n=1 Tax=Caballeronia sordidicola TaxID=196367 RepID=A0A158HBW6_CABSO|nr:Hsp70 family protein [Caballeronia sordidicola]SAL41806.1 chaperone heat-shock protein [Caballeronia sordidicola]
MKQYIVGIDLGTSNTVVAYADARARNGSKEIRVFDIDQLVSLGEVAGRPLLPSARYHPASGELNAGDLQLPWRNANPAEEPQAVIGRLARALGAQVPGRLVASAKSWLSHASVDRVAPILPWGAPDDVGKVSPVAASASYLAHVRAAWNAHFPHARMETQDVVLTVPASFDDGARALTLEAARMAGLPQLRLLEEPQAAFYDWLFQHRATLDSELAQTRLVLICDVGGGTTDLTLIKVELKNGEPAGEPQLTRIGVGNHLMLGGDNMDLALAHLVEARMATTSARLSAASLSQLVERCRAAKEQLLGANAPETMSITLLGAGSRMIGGARSVEVSRQEVEQIIVDGFFPAVASSERPRRSRSAIVEFGLPYASDAGITRHIAAFLNQHTAQSREALDSPEADRDTLPVPDTLLLNGGVFRAEALAARLADTLGSWRGKPLHALHNDNPDVAVARGAVAYGLARGGVGPRIGGGAARSYFLVLEDEGQEKGASQQGICLLPRGTEEGREVFLQDRVFTLLLGSPVRFHLVSSTGDRVYAPGELVDLSTGDFVRLPPIATVVQPRFAKGPRETPVQLSASLTEVGTLEVHCIDQGDPSKRWQLEFQLRREASANTTVGEILHPSYDRAIEQIDRSFGARAHDVDRKEIKRLRAQLEHVLGPRDTWDSALLRELFGALWERARRRRRSPDHERLWLNLAGYCLRPGFGYPLDEWRVEQLWTLFDDGIQYLNDAQVWSEWWTLWRRAAGGLNEAQQVAVLDAVDYVQSIAAARTKTKAPFDASKTGHADMVRLVASLERVPVERKIDVAQKLFARLEKPSENHQGWWAIGRIGARRPFYGSAHGVVPPDIAAQWLERIFALDWKKVEPAAFAAAQIARMTGDRSRDLPDDVRARVVHRLENAGASKSWIEMVRETVELDKADEGRVFGESLPPGLKLIADV